MEQRTSLHEWHKSVPKSTIVTTMLGIALLLVAFAGFGSWAALAPLKSAVVASGKLIATGQNKIIQHLEGGIVEEILVDEGEVVAAGQLLLRMSDTAARAQLRRLELKRFRMLTMRDRLSAERRRETTFTFDHGLSGQLSDPEVKKIVEGQHLEFEARQDELRTQIAVLRKRIDAVHEEITGLEAQRKASSSQLALIEEEIGDQSSLLEKGLSRKTSLLALKRAKAKLEGERGATIAQIGRAKERITETESQIIHLRSQSVQRSVEELRKVEADFDDVSQSVMAATDILTRLEVRAPVRGIIVKLSHHTPGGVIRAGEEIIELLPIEEKLLVEALIQPTDIDSVQKGSKAQLRLTALNQRITPMVGGEVVYVSADTVEGKNGEQVFYVSRIKIDDSEANTLADLKTAPGMPVEVYIETGERTFLEYVAKPILDSLSRAFREG